MADINVENFYKNMGKILSMLYASFPTKTPVYVDEVAGIDDPDEYGLHSPHYTAGFYAMIWLAEEGFVRYASAIREDGIDQACLTQRAFLILTQVAEPICSESVGESEESNVVRLTREEEATLTPSVQEDRKLVINQLRNALKSGSSIAVKKVVQHILKSTH